MPDNLTAICEGGVCVEGCRSVDDHDADCVVLIGLKVFRGTKIAGYCSSVEGGNFLRVNKTTCFRADTACLGFDEMCSNSSANMCAFCEGSQCAEGCAADANCLGIGFFMYLKCFVEAIRCPELFLGLSYSLPQVTTRCALCPTTTTASTATTTTAPMDAHQTPTVQSPTLCVGRFSLTDADVVRIQTARLFIQP